MTSTCFCMAENGALGKWSPGPWPQIQSETFPSGFGHVPHLLLMAERQSKCYARLFSHFSVWIHMSTHGSHCSTFQGKLLCRRSHSPFVQYAIDWSLAWHLGNSGFAVTALIAWPSHCSQLRFGFYSSTPTAVLASFPLTCDGQGFLFCFLVFVFLNWLKHLIYDFQ